ncbi:hypothetical protein B0191_18775 [Leptospira interrogans serovar Hardjo]|nr:hypothetical protein B0191_18775 [Leptospira interrogans serovar Hardjo]
MKGYILELLKDFITAINKTTSIDRFHKIETMENSSFNNSNILKLTYNLYRNLILLYWKDQAVRNSVPVLRQS